MSGLRRLRVAELYPNLICTLCGGYYVDATTIVECLHSFCKTCIVRYLESSKFCPICDVQVHKTKPLLSIRLDKTLQDIVYKLVPGLYQNEMCRRREFYTGHPETQPVSQEDGGSDVGRWYILPDDPVSLALYPAPPILNQSLPTHSTNHSHPADDTSMTRGDSMPRLSEVTKICGSHVRYLQCPAGVSVAQLKRLLRAKFGVGPSHPMALLTCSSDNPLNDTLTLVDVAYITSWQRTEPLQLLYRIYERASKKIKLDLDTICKDTSNLSEDMPKLEPNIGTDISSVMCSSSESTGSFSDYRSAPLLQAVGALGYHMPLKKEKSEVTPVSTSSTEQMEVTKQQIMNVGEELQVPSCEKGSSTQMIGNSASELKQGISEKSGSEVQGGQSVSCTGDFSRSSAATYPSNFTSPSNGVNVGIAFMPGEVQCVASPPAPCAASESCIPVTEGSVEGIATSNISAERHSNGGVGESSSTSWSGSGLKKETGAGTHEGVVDESKNERDCKKGEEEGKEVQLKISETGVMSVCGQDTTVEGVINSLQTEACELLSKIESGSLCEDFPMKDILRQQKSSGDSSGGNKIPKVKETERASSGECSKSNERESVDKEDKGEQRLSLNAEGTAALNHTSVGRDVKEAKMGEIVTVDTGCKGSREKTADKRLVDVRKAVDQQISNSVKETSSSGKDGRSSHIPASLTAASLANLNKPHLKAGTSKSQVEEEGKLKEKPNNNGVNPKKEGKEQGSKGPGGGCRKSSQPYGYKTLKTPPKSWNPTISREHLVAGKSSIKGNHETPRTNKFFKARNAPRFLGNPNTGVKSLYSGTTDINSHTKRTIASKVDSKPSGPVTVSAGNDPTSLNVPGVNTCVSSVQPASSGVAITSTTASHPVVTNTPQTNSCTTAAGGQHVGSEANNVLVSSTKAPTLPAPLESGIKESTNQSSKVCFNTNSMVENKESKSTEQNNGKTVMNHRPTPTLNNSGSKHEKKPQNTTQSNSKSQGSGEGTMTKTETKVSCSSAVQSAWTTMMQTVTSAPVLIQQKAGGSTSVTACITQAKPATVNSMSIPNAVQQPQQHLTLATPAVGVGIIPSCGVTFPTAIGNLPLSCHTSSSISYPTYPYMYQGPEPISLIPPHPSAPFMPTFPTCLPHRPTLGPRSMGTKMMPDLSLQPNLLPMVPLVSQVPPQTLSPRPMTPPSPRTPTSSQSPRPHPAQSPRQLTASQSRPVTPQSPKPSQISKFENQPTKLSGTPALASSHSVKLGGVSVQSAQTHWPAACHKQVVGPSQMFSSQPSPQPPAPPPTYSSVNTSLRLNASVQTSSSHTLTTPKTQWNSVNSKPVVPQSSKSPMVNVPGVSNTHAGHAAMPEASQAYTPQSPKSPRPNTPQSPRLSSSTQCPGPQGVGKLTSASESPRPHTPHSRSLTSHPRPPSQTKNCGNKDKALIPESLGSKRSDAVVSETSVSCGANLPVITPSISFAPAVTTVSSGSLAPTITNSLGNKFILPQGAQVALPLQASFTSLYLEGVTSALPITLSNPGMSPDLSGSALSPSCNTSLFIPSSNISSSMPFIPFSTPTQLPIPVCTVASISQPLCATNTTVSQNLNMLNTKIPAIPLNNAQTSKQSGSIKTTVSNLSNISSAVQTVGSFAGAALSCNSVTMSTQSGTFLPVPCSNVSAPLAFPRPVSTACITTTSDTLTTSRSTTAAAPIASSTCASSANNYQSAVTLPTNNSASATIDTSIIGSGTLSMASTQLPAVLAHTSLSPTVSSTFVGTTTAVVGLPKQQAVSTAIVGAHSKNPSTTELVSVTPVTGSSNSGKLSSNIAKSASEFSNTSAVTKSASLLYTQAILSCNQATVSQPVSHATVETVPAEVSMPVASKSSAGMMLPKDKPSAVINSLDIPLSGDKTACGSSAPVCNTTVVSGPQSSECFSPCGTMADGKTVVSVKEQGGSEPQLSACTSVCDVTHVIEAKQPCAEQGVSSSGGPRPCLKS